MRVARLTRFSAPTLTNCKRKSCRGNQPVFDAARRADKQHLGLVVALQLLGDGESGDHVSASASARQNGSHAMTINGTGSHIRGRRAHSACLVTLSSTPTQASVMKMRAAVRNQWQRDAFRRHQPQHHADVDKSLHYHHAGDADGQKTPKNILGTQRGANAAPRKMANKEQRSAHPAGPVLRRARKK